jgi:catechol 1,2-dioxygenase/hydroxyquinol 1,2-dioxygenase
MRDIRLDNITQAAVASFAGLPDARQRLLVQQLVTQLHRFAKDVGLTHEEWRGAIAFLHRVGAMSNESRSEFSLLSDVSGLSSLIDLLASDPGATPGSVLGPFHTAGSPWLANPANLVGANDGERMLLRGRVCSVDGEALPEATLDYWQNAANGMYWQMDRSQPSENLRCQLQVDANGCFEIATLRPVPYRIPTDGPVWRDLVEPAGRSAWRPAHVHLIVSAPGCRTLVTELFDAQDPHLDSDAVFGVRAALVGHCDRVADAAACARLGWPGSECLVMEVEFRLAAQAGPAVDP